MTSSVPASVAVPAAAGKSGGNRKAAGAPTNRKLKLRGAWNDSADRLVQSCVLASRNGGGGDVEVEGFGVKATIQVKQSRDSEPTLVTETRKLHLQSVDARQQRQQSRLEKVVKTAPPEVPGDEQPEPSRRKKRREKRKQDRADLRALRSAAEDVAMTSVAENALCGPAVEEGAALIRHGIDQVSRRARLLANTVSTTVVVGRSIVLEDDGEPLPVMVAAGTVGASLSDRQLGDELIDAVICTASDREGRFSKFATRCFSDAPAMIPSNSPSHLAAAAAASPMGLASGTGSSPVPAFHFGVANSLSSPNTIQASPFSPMGGSDDI